MACTVCEKPGFFIQDQGLEKPDVSSLISPEENACNWFSNQLSTCQCVQDKDFEQEVLL